MRRMYEPMYDYGRGGYPREEYDERRTYRDRDMREHENEYDPRYENDYARRGGRRDYGYEDERKEYQGYYGDRPFYVEETEDYRSRRGGRMNGRMRERMDYRMDERMRRGGRRDRGHGMEHDDLEEWKMKLMHELEDSEKEIFKMDKVIKRAGDLRVDFSKFSEEELYVTVLMMYTDYKTTLGKGNVDVYIRIAKDFLCDEDASVQYGDKLMEYYEAIVK